MNRRDRGDKGTPAWRRIGLGAVLLAVVAVVGLAPTPRAGAAGPLVEIKHHKYVPATLTVPVGTTVTWINRDDDVHTVISTAEKFRSRGMDTDEKFSQTFTVPGTYEYFCTLHPLMKAKVIVK